MDMKPLKRKRKSSDDKKLKLPLKNEKKIVGIFNGLTVAVHDLSSMNYLYQEGCFGKGSLSKREPNYHTKKDDIPKIVFEQQVKNQSIWNPGSEYVCPQKHFTSRNDYELSISSVESFLKYCLDASDKNSHKSWPQCPGSEKDLKRELSFLEIHSAEQYSDVNLKNLVDEILHTRQGRKCTALSFKPKNEVIVVDSQSNIPLSTIDALNARLESDIFLPEENLNLSWEESLYLKSVLGCLTIIDTEKKNLTSSELWEKFKAKDKNFVGRYVTYHFFRSKGWIVKSGLKFGGDYLLYKIGPAHYHSNYLVKVLNEKKLTWREVIANNRLAETFSKDVVFVRILLHQGEHEGIPFPEILKSYMVEATLVSRWFPSKERNLKN